MSWINIEKTKQYPPENTTVWICNENTGWVKLGVYIYIANEGWTWAELDTFIYGENGKIVIEAVTEDDYDVTHWHSVPDLPIKQSEVVNEN